MQALIVLAALGGFALLVVAIIKANKKQQAALAASLSQSGFQAVAHLDGDLEQAFLGMLPRGRTSRSPMNVYRHAALDYDLYRFDVRGHDHTETRFAMVFRRPLFPAFVLMPNLKLPGFLNSLVQKLLQTALSGSGFQEVEVPGKPQFREKCRLLARDHQHILSVVPADVWERLAAFPGYLCLQGDGSVLLLQEMVTGRNRSSNDPRAELRRMVERADALWGVFRDLQPQEGHGGKGERKGVRTLFQ